MNPRDKRLAEAIKGDKRAVDSGMIRDVADSIAPASIGVLEPPRWEYQSVLGPRLMNISDFGQKRWELVSVIAQPGDQAVFYFRRPKR